MEFLDVVDENGELTGEVVEKEVAHEKGVWHREVVVWVVNGRGELLLQKRAMSKKEHPGKWGLCAGHVDIGEGVKVAAARELYEEVGVKVGEDELELLAVDKLRVDFPNGRKNYNFAHMYFLRTELGVGDFVIQEEELSEVKYVSIGVVKEMVKVGSSELTFSRLEGVIGVLEELERRCGE